MIRTHCYIQGGTPALKNNLPVEELVDAWQHRNAVIWIDIEGGTKDDLMPLAGVFDLKQELIEDCFEGEQRGRLDHYEQYLFVLMYASIGMSDPPQFLPRKVCYILGERFLITVHEKRARAFNALHERLSHSGSVALRRGADFLAYCLIDGLVDNAVLCAEYYETTLDQLEDKALAGEVDTTVLNTLAELRWDLNGFKRNLISMRELLLSLSGGSHDEISADLEFRFRHIIDHVTLAQEIVESLRDIMQSIRDAYNAQLSEKTNRLMRILTLFATLMMPLSLIAGIYGMNMPLWPAMDDPMTFWMVLGVMGVVAVFMYIFFRIREWL